MRHKLCADRVISHPKVLDPLPLERPHQCRRRERSGQYSFLPSGDRHCAVDPGLETMHRAEPRGEDPKRREFPRLVQFEWVCDRRHPSQPPD